MKSKFERARRVPGRGWFFLFVVWGFCRNVASIPYFTLWRYEMRARERVPREGPLVYVANHTSHMDPPAVGLLVTDRPCGFLARIGLFDFKPFGWLIRMLGSVPLDTKRAGLSALRAALTELEAGRCVLLFPEGMRTPDGRAGRYRSGFLLLARKSNATIVPIALSGFFEIWPRTQKFPRLTGRTAGEVCEPITPEVYGDLEDAAVVELVMRRIETTRLELRAHIREKTGGRFAPLGPLDVPAWEHVKGDGPQDAATAVTPAGDTT